MTSHNPIEPVPARHWRHVSGHTASLFGAVPYMSEAEKAEWEIVTSGWTWRDNHRGTVGLGRPPVATFEEAKEIADSAGARLYPHLRLVG